MRRNFVQSVEEIEDHMKREKLKAIGLTDEQIKEVMKVNGSDIETAKAKAT